MMLCDKGNIVGTDHDRAFVHIRRRDFEQSTFGVRDKDASKSFVIVPVLIRIDLGTDRKPGKKMRINIPRKKDSTRMLTSFH